MTNEFNNPNDPKTRIIETFLEEIVADHAPSDLTATILQKLNSGNLNASPPRSVHASNPMAPIPNGANLDVAATVNGTSSKTSANLNAGNAVISKSAGRDPADSSNCGQTETTFVVNARKRRTVSSSQHARWLVWNSVAAVSLVTLTMLLCYLFANRDNAIGGNYGVAENIDFGTITPVDATLLPDQNVTGSNTSLANLAHRATGNGIELDSDESSKSQQLPNAILITEVAPPPEVMPVDVVPSESQPQLDPIEIPSMIASGELVELIDGRLEKLWQRNNLVSQIAPVDSHIWAKRLVQKLTGREISESELKQFDQFPQVSQRSDFIEWFFEQPDQLDEFANDWSRYLASTLVGQTMTVKNQLPDYDRANAHLLAHLRYSLYHNEPYDQIVRELVTANGSLHPANSDYDGAAGYLISISNNHRNRELVGMTSQVVRAFWGQRMQCAQCHNDESANVDQEEFWMIGALMRDFRISHKDGAEKLVAVPYPHSPLFFEAGDGRLIAVDPQLDPNSDSSRATLVHQLIRNPRFGEQAVNIVWTKLLGYGLVNPPGDIGAHNPSIDDQLLATLGEQFRAHGYSLRNVIEWVALSAAFDRPDSSGSTIDQPELNGRPLFSQFYMRPLPSDELTIEQSLQLVAKSLNESASDDLDRSTTAKRALLSRAVPGFDSKNRNKIALPVNGLPKGTTEWGTAPGYSQTMEKIIASDLSDEHKVVHLFWLSGNRLPDKRELGICMTILERNPNRKEAFQDIWWAISRR